MSQARNVTATFNPQTLRTVRVVAASGSPGGTVAVPIVLDAQGDENALGFSITFDPAVLSNPTAALGSDAASATLIVNAAQAAQGRYGVLIGLPAGQAFAAGAKQVVVVTMTIASDAAAETTPVAFGDQPVVREVSNVTSVSVPANWTSGTVTIIHGYEADVAPRPNGNGSLTASDWSQCGRFVAGLDPVTAGNEFARADVAPRATLGDGRLTASDYSQCGRYVAGLDPMTPAGGPTAPANAPLFTVMSANAAMRLVAATPKAMADGTVTVTITLTGQGDENAVSFSTTFDPALLTYISARLGPGVANATLFTNTRDVAVGHVGFVVGLPPGRAGAAGTRDVVVLTFAVRSGASSTAATVGFGDDPVAQDVASVEAEPLPASFTPTTEGVGDGAAFSATRQQAGAGGGDANARFVPSLPDFDRNGTADFVARNEVTGDTVAWLVTPGLGLTSRLLARPSDGAWQVAKVIDFNRDGVPDVLWRNASTGEYAIGFMHGPNLVDAKPLTGFAEPWQVAAGGDFDGDGHADLLWHNAATGENVLWFLADGSYTGRSVALAPMRKPWQVVRAADFNGDGVADVLWRNDATGETVIWFANAGAQTALAPQPAEWKVAGLGDFNGDGHVDLLWHNADTGEAEIWLLTSGADTGTRVPLHGMTPTWQIAAVGDYDGDGVSVVCWRNSTTGNRVIGYLDAYRSMRTSQPLSLDSVWRIMSGLL
jgi:hypothetical protein